MIAACEYDGWFLPKGPRKTGRCPAVRYGVVDVKEYAGDADIAAALSAVAGLNPTSSEHSRYKTFTLLLNLVSRRWWARSASFRKEHKSTLVFTCTGTRAPTDDWLKLKVQPDFLSFESDNDQLNQVIEDCQNTAKLWTAFPLPRYVEVNNALELKRDRTISMAQLTTYLAAVKRYRPDLNTVYGFFIDKGIVRIAALNACGMWHSEVAPVDSIQPWVAFVSAAYYSLDNRNRRIELVKELSTFQCWNVELLSKSVASVVPLHVGEAVGRTTYATLELAECTQEDFVSGEAKGFLKASWQDKSARWKENEILNRIHRDQYLPGVVRTQHVEVSEAVSEPGETKARLQRQLEIIHLGSVGEPLSQIISIRHWLFAAYDTIESHLLLCEEGILHRDLSWANCLVFPRHFVEGDKPEKERPCIAAIVAAAGVELSPEARELGRRLKPINGREYEPCAIISDFDHAAEIDAHNLGKNTGCTEWTGTPMFIACELAYPAAIKTSNRLTFSWDGLRKALEEIEGTERGRAAFRAAGLHKDESFMGTFLKIVEMEKQRRQKASENDIPVPVNTSGFHEWRHDCESVFWWLLWGIGRAEPRDSSSDDDDKGDYNVFCIAMLNHEVGNMTTESARTAYFDAVRLQESSILHPEFHRIRMLLSNMAAYLSIPWFLYTNDKRVDLKDNHAHVALRRLILAWAIREDLPFLDVLLNTERPRLADLAPSRVYAKTPALPLRSATGESASTAAVTPRESESQIKSRGTDRSYPRSFEQRESQRNRSSKASSAQSVEKKNVPLPPRFPTSDNRSRPASASSSGRFIRGDTSGTDASTNVHPRKRSRVLSGVHDDDRPTKKVKPDECEEEDGAGDGNPLEDETEIMDVLRRSKSYGRETDAGDEFEDSGGEDDGLGNDDFETEIGQESKNDTGDEDDVTMAEAHEDTADAPSEVDVSTSAPVVSKTSKSLRHDYDESLHPSKSVYALRLKFWKDIAYWFGSGA